MTTLCFLWHMHQPFYKDLWSGQYKLPWTRLHALKDYAGMVEILAEFPGVHQTFNLVPSMVAQIDDYAEGTASDPFLDCALAPAEDLSEAQRNFIFKYFFQANAEKIIHRYPRYRELYEKRDPFSTQDMRDLQIFSQIAWFDEDLLARDPELIELIRLMARKQKQALERVLPAYRQFAARGQIEISTTPFYHPILPLLCDSDIGAVPHPGLRLPSRFHYPQDARHQLERAYTYMEEKFGVVPAGLWPSEGSVSDHALALAADCGFQWAASDNGVLGRTLGRDAGVDVTYRPYVWQQGGREMKMLFRDHYLSDLIGFEYARMSPADAAYFDARYADFDKRLAEAQKRWDALMAPYKGLKVVTYHRSWPNFCERFGLDVMGYVEPRPGIPPSPGHTLDLIGEMKRQNVKILMVEPYFDLKTPQSISRETGAKVLVLLPSVGGEKEITDYVKLFDYDVNLLVAAIKETGAR